MTITIAKRNRPGVRTFYVNSNSGSRYVVTHVRRAGMNRWSCTCPDFTFRRQVKRSHRFCKHIRAARAGQFEILKENVIAFANSLSAQLRASIAAVEAKKESRA